jgi:hypothetical protein
VTAGERRWQGRRAEEERRGEERRGGGRGGEMGRRGEERRNALEALISHPILSYPIC